MGFRGSNGRFKLSHATLGTYTNTSSRTLYKKDIKDISYSSTDQYLQTPIRKVGARYIHTYRIYDFTSANKDLLLSLNAEVVTFYQFSDSVNALECYCDVYYDPFSQYPKSSIQIILTEVEANTNPDIVPLPMRDKGFYSFNGIANAVATPITANGSIWSISVDFNAAELSSLSYCWLTGSYITSGNKWIFGFDYFGRLFFQHYSGTALESYYIDDSAIIKDDDWHTAKLEVDHMAKTVKIRWDGVLRLLSAAIPETGVEITGKTLQINNISPKPTEILMNNIIFTSSIAKNNFTYAMNEKIPSGSEPYTGYTEDSSGDSNHGTPIVVEGNKEDFFNHVGADWELEENIIPYSMYPKIEHGTEVLEYFVDLDKPMSLDSVQFKNKIDVEMVSITGKLHRRYARDVDDRVLIDTSFEYSKYNVTLSDYKTLRYFDRKDVKFTPIKDFETEDGRYYTASCSIQFPVYKNTLYTDFAKLKFKCVGNISE